MLLVPLYHKVRIAWDWVLAVITGFDKFLSDLSKIQGAPKLDDLEWDVFLSDVNEVKSDLLSNKVLDGKTRTIVVTRPMPKFVWRAIARRAESEVIDVLIDATDIETGDALVQVIMHDQAAYLLLKQLAGAPQFESSQINDRAKKVLRWIRDH